MSIRRHRGGCARVLLNWRFWASIVSQDHWRITMTEWIGFAVIILVIILVMVLPEDMFP